MESRRQEREAQNARGAGPDQSSSAYILRASELQRVFDHFAARGVDVIGPTVRDGAIGHDVLKQASELPRGVLDHQAAGSYRLEHTTAPHYFAFNHGAALPRNLLQPERERLWTVRRSRTGETLFPASLPTRKRVLFGVRPCDLAGIDRLDRAQLAAPSPDRRYAAHRDQLILIAVNCSRVGANCFCGAMGTGPDAGAGFDLLLTELAEPGNHRFTVEVGTQAGAEIVSDLQLEPETPRERAARERVIEAARTAASSSSALTPLRAHRTIDHEHPAWEQIATRCLSCANCTLVCPTCFCFSNAEVEDIEAGAVHHERFHDSCFNDGFSYVGGHEARASIKSRYRQWFSHKFVTWHEQFGSSGCVGCGRCVTWCPVGIDVRKEFFNLSPEAQ